MADLFPAAETPNPGAPADPFLASLDMASLAMTIAETLETASMWRPPYAAESMLSVGQALINIKPHVKRGSYMKFVHERLKLHSHKAWAMTKFARRVTAANIPPAHFEKLSELAMSRITDLVMLPKGGFKDLVEKGAWEGIELAALAGMREAEFIAVIENAKASAAQIQQRSVIQENVVDFPPPLHPGDRVTSAYAERPGTVVKTYPDGSACVRWDDGEPQEEGLGHERMPRRLLKAVPPGAKTAKLAEMKSANVALLPDSAAEKRKAYCVELLKTTLRYVEGDELQATADTLEDLVQAIAERRPAPGLVAARYDLFSRFWLREGGAR